ncbi:stage V sporulation protein T [Clostridium cylindrosporum]|uniref:Stage V sporulation protein T n=1 Tax=Clostridium cylindrosporum DSM 605 TaxID=1121307 RepID=A0A0J8G2X4_CLOCY|nr:stage V sporulation protein T [Clostridium cylindrosporum]KMT22051.1 stage V sporulation protein T [Clostridium cylindrosporum DSM 605]
MKATGIVRRIDDLGRVVIPKEIRRTLRIREGDPLEIFTDRDGGVILKKYSPIGELTEFAKDYAEALNQSSGYGVLICDRDVIISVAGLSKKEYIDRRISEDVEKILTERKTILLSKETSKPYPLTVEEDDGSEYSFEVISPIISEGDAIGAIAIISKEEGNVPTDVEKKLAEAAAIFIGRQME